MSRHRPEEIHRTGEIPLRRTYAGDFETPPMWERVSDPDPAPVSYGRVLAVTAACFALVLLTSGAAWWLADYLAGAPVWVE